MFCSHKALDTVSHAITRELEKHVQGATTKTWEGKPVRTKFMVKEDSAQHKLFIF